MLKIGVGEKVSDMEIDMDKLSKNWEKKDDKPHVTPSIDDVVALLMEMPDDDRAEVFSHFCTFCGSSDTNCYCMRDD